MSTISIDKKKLNSFNGVIEKVINSAEGLEGRLEGIRSILQGVKDSNTDLQNTVENISSSSKTESEKIEELKKISKQVDSFIETAVSKDNLVKDEINKGKDNFYSQHRYLKPTCEKGFLECIVDGIVSVAEWCKKHWRLIVAIVIVIVAITVLWLAATGTILIGAMTSGACWGALLGAAGGGPLSALICIFKGGSLEEIFEAFEKGAFDGAIGGLLGGGIAGAIASKLGPGLTLMSNIGKNVVNGAVSTAISNMAVTSMDNLIEDGTLKLGEILKSGLIGILVGGGTGVILGKLTFAKKPGGEPKVKTTTEEKGKAPVEEYTPATSEETKISVKEEGTVTDDIKLQMESVKNNFGLSKEEVANLLIKQKDPRYSHLDLNQIEGLDIYVAGGENLKEINNSFRLQFASISAKNKLAAQNIESALKKSVYSGNETLYRGTSSVELKEVFDENINNMIGKTFTEKAFTSTTVSNAKAEEYAKGVILQIKNPKGCNALDVSGISNVKGIKKEQEVLFNVKQEFKIVDVSHINENITVTVVPKKTINGKEVWPEYNPRDILAELKSFKLDNKFSF